MKFNLFVLPTVPASLAERQELRPIGRNTERYQQMLEQIRRLAVMADDAGFDAMSTTENWLHYRRDVTFREDATRLTCGHAGRVMATLNNLVIGVLRHAGHSNLAAARRRYNADLHASLALLMPPV